MNILKFYPEKLRENYIQNIKHSGSDVPVAKYANKVFFFTLIFSLACSILFYILKISEIYAIIIFIFLNLFFYFKVSLKSSARIKQMEKTFPDVISLMASNLRSGITIDRAFLLSARPEFHPLDKEIMKTGQEITTGKEIVFAFKNMAERIRSEKISKVVMLIISGLKAGGNIADLLEQTSSNMKAKEIIEKKSASTILMYVIFIAFAVGVGAPVLFALSSVLVEVVINLSSQMPDVASMQTNMNLPFTFGEVSITVNFVIYFSIAFILVTDLISSIVIGLVSKGEGKAGLKYFIPLSVASLTLFFILRIVLSKVLGEVLPF